MQQKNFNTAELQQIIAKADKRRFDGGSEVDLIRYIENRKLQMAYAGAPATRPQPVQQRQNTVSHTPAKRSKRVVAALAAGPMEVAVGSVGILTSGLAIATFSRMGNPEMASQSKHVLRQCVRTLGQGVVNTALAPVKAIRVIFSK